MKGTGSFFADDKNPQMKARKDQVITPTPSSINSCYSSRKYTLFLSIFSPDNIAGIWDFHFRVGGTVGWDLAQTIGLYQRQM